MSTTTAASPAETTTFWIRYFAERIRAVFNDSTLDARTTREWVLEITEDLDELIQPPDDSSSTTLLAHSLAHAMHQHIFYNGPDPDTLPAFESVPR